jgi:hypothetical protein
VTRQVVNLEIAMDDTSGPALRLPFSNPPRPLDKERVELFRAPYLANLLARLFDPGLALCRGDFEQRVDLTREVGFGIWVGGERAGEVERRERDRR